MLGIQILFYLIVIFLHIVNKKQTEKENNLKANALVSSGTKFCKPEKHAKYMHV